MGSLQRVKHLTTRCAIADSPTRSPSTSPVVHLRRRRRKTLRMLLNHSDDRRQFHPNSPEVRVPRDGEAQDRAGGLRSRCKLKDLFVSSPPLQGVTESDNGVEIGGRLLMTETGAPGSSSAGHRRYIGSLRQAVGPFRYRLLRRAWRPVLVPIPE